MADDNQAGRGPAAAGMSPAGAYGFTPQQVARIKVLLMMIERGGMVDPKVFASLGDPEPEAADFYRDAACDLLQLWQTVNAGRPLPEDEDSLFVINLIASGGNRLNDALDSFR